MRSWKVENGDVVVASKQITQIENLEAVRQRLRDSIKLFYGEFFLSPTAGVDWASIMDEKLSQNLIVSEIRRVILADSEVEKINSLDVSFDKSTRNFTLNFSVSTIYGELENRS